MHIKRNHCAICNNPTLKQVIDLPKLPLTGLYIDPASRLEDLPEHVREGFDQALLFCEECGHGQLLNILDSRIIYDDTYTHRGSKSPIATGGNDFLTTFLKSIVKDQTFRRAVDIGCNDLYLIQKLEPLADKLAGIDPIWKNKDHQFNQKISVLGGFVEEIDLVKALNGKPDLIVSAHTFEHVADPKQVLLNVVKNATDDALFLIEVPSFDTLLRNYRFDQVFHQHLHYYSLSSFGRLIQELGCTYVTHTYNYGFWGGTMLVAFKKGKSSKHPTFEKPKTAEIKKGFQQFKEQLSFALNSLKYRASKETYAYGAAQMLPILAYHMETDFSFLKSILDDNPSRWGLKYPTLACQIAPMKQETNLENADVMITALDSARPLLKKLSQTKAQRVILPLNIF